MFLKKTSGVYLIANCALAAKEIKTMEKSKIDFFINEFFMEVKITKSPTEVRPFEMCMVCFT
jgi:hypothetical protein